MSAPISKVYNTDCMEYLRQMSDKHFDLAICDPPYGMKEHGAQNRGKGTLRNRAYNNGRIDRWDKSPDGDYFRELFRVSKNQIICGGNYFALPPTRCFVCWDKVQPWDNFSACEYAWTSFSGPSKLFRFDNRTGGKIHPTQKPTELYAYLLRTFAKEGDSIIDTHLGSGSSRIAAYKMGFDFYGTEIDPDIFAASEERFKRECLGHVKGMDGKTYVQQTLF